MRELRSTCAGRGNPSNNGGVVRVAVLLCVLTMSCSAARPNTEHGVSSTQPTGREGSAVKRRHDRCRIFGFAAPADQTFLSYSSANGSVVSIGSGNRTVRTTCSPGLGVGSQDPLKYSYAELAAPGEWAEARPTQADPWVRVTSLPGLVVTVERIDGSNVPVGDLAGISELTDEEFLQVLKGSIRPRGEMVRSMRWMAGSDQENSGLYTLGQNGDYYLAVGSNRAGCFDLISIVQQEDESLGPMGGTTSLPASVMDSSASVNVFGTDASLLVTGRRSEIRKFGSGWRVSVVCPNRSAEWPSPGSDLALRVMDFGEFVRIAADLIQTVPLRNVPESGRG